MRIRVFNEPHSPIKEQNSRFCIYRQNTGHWKTIFSHIFCSDDLKRVFVILLNYSLMHLQELIWIFESFYWLQWKHLIFLCLHKDSNILFFFFIVTLFNMFPWWNVYCLQLPFSLIISKGVSKKHEKTRNLFNQFNIAGTENLSRKEKVNDDGINFTYFTIN